MKHQDALAQLAREITRTKRMMTLERSWRVAYWFNIFGFGWIAFALLGGQEPLPLIVQSLSTLAALGVLIYLGYRALRVWKRPTDGEARQRIALDSKFDAGAFEALQDRPTRFDAFSVALWNREREQAVERAAHARAQPASLDDVDKYRLRYVVIGLCVIGLVIAGDLRGERLWRALLPDPGPLLGDQQMEIEAWATPAPYTHAAPVSLSDRVGERVETPPSVEVTVRVTGPTGAPRLVFAGQRRGRDVRFVRAADGAWEAHLAIPGAGRLKIVRFHTRAEWRIAPAPDAAPKASFSAPLAELPNEHVSFAWEANDDFGITRMALRVRPVNPPVGLVHADPVDTPIEAPAGEPREGAAQAEIDLAEHPYAGMDVEASVVAFDALGQAGESAPQRFTLPEKVFLQPLARAAIEIRRAIVWERRPYRPARREPRRTMPAGDILLGNQRIAIRDYDRNPPLRRAPDGMRHAARLLDALTMTPQDGYFRDLAVFLDLRLAHTELSNAQNVGETNQAATTLWRAALRAEYGGAADTRRALEEAQRALAEALQNHAPQERIRQLLQALRQATEAYLQSLVQEALRNGQTAQNQDDTQDQTSISENDIQDLLRQVQQLTEQGRTQEAQQLLAMLAGILANLDARLDQSQQNGQQQSGDQQEQAEQSMDQLNQAIGEQRALNNDTQQESQQQQQDQQSPQQQQQAQGGGGGDHQGGEGGQELAQRQSNIQQGLQAAQEMSDAAGQAPSQDLNAARGAMQQAENALRRGDFQGAQAAQNAALDHLREGAEQLASQMRQGAQQQGARQGQSGPRDPLGRVMPGGGAGDGDTRVPTDLDPARSRQIFDEIRRRAQDPNRPQAEREYLRRLLERFDGS